MPREIGLVGKAAFLLRNSPLHPQWLVFRSERRNLMQISAAAEGVVLDVGCAAQKPRALLAHGCSYVGLDFLVTAAEWYGTRPDVYGDAQVLPIASGRVDSLLLLDVLEHLPRPHDCLAEIHRVLKPGGKLILQVPFIYPVHDAPLDFQRWTIHGLRELARTHGFAINEEVPLDSPVESAGLMANIALSKTALDWFHRKSPLVVSLVLLPLLVLAINCSAWIIGALSGADAFMPSGYRMVWVKE